MRSWSWQDQSIDLDKDGIETTTSIRPNRKQILLIVLKWISITTLVGILTFFTIFGIDFNPRITLRGDLSPSRPDSGPLTSSCFDGYIREKSLNQYYGIIPSVPVIEDDVCFEYASLIKPSQQRYNNTTKIIFHTFWSSKMNSFTSTELATLRSFIATQPSSALLYLWISENDQFLLEKSSLFQSIKERRIQLKIINNDLIKDTPLSFSTFWQLQSSSIQNLLRLTTLYKFGGVWFDLDILFVRDISPLLSQEWSSQASCLESSGGTSRFEGSFLHFFKKSPYLCEMLTEANKHNDDALLGSTLYARIHYRLLHYKIQTWAVLPWCFTDPTQCKSLNSLPNNDGDFDKNKLLKVFAFHWYKSPGSIFKYLVNQHKEIISW